ncbi:FAD-binding oxidoreductase [Aureispira sp. CCB-QB1]|uniref:NAD(P)/FAD-dependent oxidoreductase n=1 Tax=Aureispira sp. CCB-QB1 TaxID=1313421 RepID=UPI0006992088|nr:FAD-dependent oxidoreductase [Aureispira sp. CCB-QB1]
MNYTTQQHSNWWDGPESFQPCLEQDITTEVAIIGGGFTGLYTALQLREFGVDVSVLEKGFAGSAGSGRNSGYVDSLIGKDFPSLLKMNRLERAKELCNFSVEAVRRLEHFIKSHQIDCDYVDHGNINVAVHPKQIKRLKHLEVVGAELGLHFKYLEEGAMRERGIPNAFLAGIHDTIGGTVNPGKLIDFVRKLAISRGVKLYENTPVLKVHNSSPVRLDTPKGTVYAQKVVLATNAFTASLGWKKRVLSPIWAGMFETAPLSPDQQEILQWHHKEGIYTAHEKLESYRRTTRNTLIAGGKYIKIPYGFKLGDISQPQMANQIAAVFRQRFPALKDLELATFWGGWIGIPLDFMPTIGVTGKHKNIFYGMGYAGHGVPQTFLVGEILGHKVYGKEHPLGNVLTRRTLPIPPEPFKWLASTAIDKVLGWVDNRVDREVAKLERK